MHRIPGNLSEVQEIKRRGPPILLVHGLFDSDDAWVTHDELSPAFVLSRQGYDIWMGNLRGNKKSKRHLTLDPNNETFWNFSWEENGLYDIPAMIEYIVDRTGHMKIGYIGHSMGTTSVIFGMSEKPHYFQKRLNLMVALAPPLSMQNSQSYMLKYLGTQSTSYFIANLLVLFKAYEVYPSNWINQGFFKTICSHIPEACKVVDYLTADYDPDLNDELSTRVYFAHYPSGSSLKQLYHFVQCHITGKFQRYDYGPLENMIHYNQEQPPEVELSKIKKIPIAIFAGLQDNLSSIDDTRWAKEQLKDTLVHYGEYELGHLSYFTAKDFSYFTEDVVSLMKKHHPIKY